MNPLDWRGPAFLLLYLTLLLAMYVLHALFWHIEDRRARAAAARERPPDHELDPFATAYLRAGARAALNAAVLSLHHRGLVRLDHRTVEIVDEAPEVEFDRDADAGPLVSGVLESDALSAIRGNLTSYTDLQAGCRSSLAAIERALVSAGLYRPARRATGPAARFRSWALLGLVAFGVTKVSIGLSRDRPVGILLVLLVITGVLFAVHLLKRRPAAATARGERLLAERGDALQALSVTLASAPQQLSPTEVALAFGLFGGGQLPYVLPQGFERAARAAGSGDAGGLSTGCGGGGCGGGCGGGGCGGCGA